jgi:hypothetical protein
MRLLLPFLEYKLDHVLKMYFKNSSCILILSLFLLAACNEEKKEFMTPSPDEPVVDVNVDEYSLNGMVLGKTATDISAIDSLLIEPIYKELRKTREQEQIEVLKTQQSADLAGKIKLHVDENLSYGDFYKFLVSMIYAGYDEISYVIGSNYKDVFHFSFIGNSNPMFESCAILLSRMKWYRLEYLRNRQKLSIAEILDKYARDKYIPDEKIEKECYEKYSSLDLLLSYYPKGDGNAYVVSLNETFFNESRPFDGFNFYTYDNEADLWKFIENIRSRVESQDKHKKQNMVLKLLVDILAGPNNIALAFEKDILMKDIAPIIKKLSGYGYRINFSRIN